ncbi:MAG TPA: hypothetical protein VL053_02555 [Arachidicoccus sp.]|nr:hypothetical protein [Arachidicoccus sp.]
MNNPQTETALAHCCQLIEEKMDLGSGKDWSTLDFEQLREQISEQTDILLSVTTLKRIWNRVKYTSTPTSTTLNALAAFLGYKNWQDFQRAPVHQLVATPPIIASNPKAEHLDHRRNRKVIFWTLSMGLIAVLAGVFIFSQNHGSPKVLSPDKFSFSSKPVTKDLPNSVVFQYDATSANTDSVYIQQSWDPTRRHLVPAKGHEYSSIYYYPGYYQAKLIVNNQIVREHDLIIPSNGWIVAVEQDPVPVYFKSNECIKGGILHLSVENIQQKNIPMQPKPPVVYYGNVLPATDLMSDNFLFRTKLKSDFSQGSAACQHVFITIYCKHDIFFFPLCAKGCVGDIGLYLAGKGAKSTETDLSAFGCDLNQWVTVSCEVRNKRVQILIDGKKAYETTILNKPAEVLGVRYQFEGSGSVDYMRLTHLNGDIVLKDDFDSSKPALSRN